MPNPFEQDYLLSHTGLTRYPDRGDGSFEGNTDALRNDFFSGKLKGYRGFVAYQKGVLCGQSMDGLALTEEAENYYGNSGLSVFSVPGPIKKAGT